MKLESSQEALEPTTGTVDDQKHLDASLHLFTPVTRISLLSQTALSPEEERERQLELGRKYCATFFVDDQTQRARGLKASNWTQKPMSALELHRREVLSTL